MAQLFGCFDLENEDRWINKSVKSFSSDRTCHVGLALTL